MSEGEKLLAMAMSKLMETGDDTMEKVCNHVDQLHYSGVLTAKEWDLVVSCIIISRATAERLKRRLLEISQNN